MIQSQRSPMGEPEKERKLNDNKFTSIGSDGGMGAAVMVNRLSK